MATIWCPNCGQVGRFRRGESDEFPPYTGQHPLNGLQVRKCLNCGAGFKIREALVGLRTELIEPALWARMEGREPPATSAATPARAGGRSGSDAAPKIKSSDAYRTQSAYPAWLIPVLVTAVIVVVIVAATVIIATRHHGKNCTTTYVPYSNSHTTECH
jgi:hypothetical protein